MTPARSKASEISRQASGLRCRKSKAVTTTSATQERTMKNRLLFLNEPKAAPVFVTSTRVKKSGMMTRGSSGTTWRSTSHFVHLIECVEREREEEDEFHSGEGRTSNAQRSTSNVQFEALTTASQRSHKSGCAALFPTVGRCRQQRAHF